MWQLKNVHKLVNIDHIELVISVHLALVSKYICVKYEGSMITHVDRRDNYRIIEKWLPSKNIVKLT